jgi:NTP pyrophosphatase (non-canonical NTP hydrolase)
MEIQDSVITMKTLSDSIISFRDARNWKKFHNPKDLLMALNIEVAELQELVLWKNKQDIKEAESDPDFVNEVNDELADIFIYLNYLFVHFNLDISKSVINKITKNEKKYPLEKSKNNSLKYNKLK